MKGPTERRGRSVRRLGVSVFGAAMVLTAGAGAAGAQTGAGMGGPFASGSVTSVSATTLVVTSSFSDEDVSVIVDDVTAYQRVQETTLDTIEAGACVQISGTGSVKKGITAASISLVDTEDGDCDASALGGGGQNRAPFDGRRDGQTPPSLPDDLPEGIEPPEGFEPPGDGNFPGAPNGQGGNGTEGENFTTAFGTVKKMTDTSLIVKASTIGRPAGNSDEPRVTTKRATITVDDDTTITETIEATAAEVTVGSCVSASGVGDSTAFTAEQVTISQPDEEGECTGLGGRGFFPGRGGGFPGGGSPPESGGDSGDQAV